MQSTHPLLPEAYRLLHDGALALARMSHNGCRIDEERLRDRMKSCDTRSTELEGRLKDSQVWSTWAKTFGDKADLGKNEQLAQVFFGELGHRPLAFTEKTRKYKTSEDAFCHINEAFLGDYFAWKKQQKLRTTYLDGLARETVDGFVHTNFNVTNTRSYRLSSSDPNLQNIPSRDDEMMHAVAGVFVARPGNRLVWVDLSGAEVRVGYCYHKDPTMREYLLNQNSCMHADTACELFFTTRDVVAKGKPAWKALRPLAKGFVFAQQYGDIYYQCAAKLWRDMLLTEPGGGYRLKMPDGTPVIDHLRANGIKGLGSCDPRKDPLPGTYEHHVKKVEDGFWQKRFPQYTRWKLQLLRDYERTGYFDLMTGFRCKGVYRKNQVLNLGTQGSASHLILETVRVMDRWITEQNKKTLLINTIHDSLCADVPEDEVQDYLDTVHCVITEHLPKRWPWIIIPLDLEAKVTPVGGAWDEEETWIRGPSGWGPVPKKG